MIDPKSFYPEHDRPDEKTREQVWSGIARSLPQQQMLFIPRMERRSFLYGMAASFIIFFTGLGMVTVYKNIVELSQPTEIKTDKAYQSAIKAFENVLLSSGPSSVRSDKDDIASLRALQLQYLNNAIEELRREMGMNDLSPLKRQRLNQLYTLKLNMLQDMIQQGELQL